MTAGVKPSDLSRVSALRWESFCALRPVQANAIRLAARRVAGIGRRGRRAAVERLGEQLDALGCRVERRRDRMFGRLGAVGHGPARVLQRLELVLDAARLEPLLAQLV